MPSPRLPAFLRSTLSKALDWCIKGPSIGEDDTGPPLFYEGRTRQWIAAWVTSAQTSIPREGGRRLDIALADVLDRKLPELVRDDLILALGHLRTGPVLSVEDATTASSARAAIVRWLHRDIVPALRRCLAWAEGAQSSV